MAHLNNKSTTSYFFSFHPGTSLVHQVPAAIKLLVVPVLSLAVFLLPPTFSICLLVIQFLLALYAGISIQEQIKDLKPVFLYLILLELFQLINGINQMTAILNEFYSASSQSLSAQHLEQITAEKMTEALQTPQPQPLTMTSLFYQVFCSKEFIQTQKNLLFMFSRLFALLQASSLLYKTTSSLQIRSGIAFLERKITHTTTTRFTDSLFMFVNFIPMISRIFHDLQKAWLARGGKKNLKMYATILSALFSVGMKKAWSLTRALQVRN